MNINVEFLTEGECKQINGGGKLNHWLGYAAHWLVDNLAWHAEIDSKYHNMPY